MKKLILLAGVASLAACSQPETETVDDPVVEDVAVNEDVGLFEVTDADGNSALTRMNADGTYSDVVDGEDTGGGTWVRNEEGQVCFTGSDEGSEAACWTDTDPGPDGSWTATGPNGETVTVRRVEEEAAPTV